MATLHSLYPCDMITSNAVDHRAEIQTIEVASTMGPESTAPCVKALAQLSDV